VSFPESVITIPNSLGSPLSIAPSNIPKSFRKGSVPVDHHKDVASFKLNYVCDADTSYRNDVLGHLSLEPTTYRLFGHQSKTSVYSYHDLRIIMKLHVLQRHRKQLMLIKHINFAVEKGNDSGRVENALHYVLEALDCVRSWFRDNLSWEVSVMHNRVPQVSEVLGWLLPVPRFVLSALPRRRSPGKHTR